MDLIGADKTLFAAVGAVVGGVLLELVKRWSNKADKEQDDTVTIRHEHAQMRDELRKDLGTARDRLGAVETDRDAWKTKFYDQVATAGKLALELSALHTELKLLSHRCEVAERDLTRMRMAVSALPLTDSP